RPAPAGVRRRAPGDGARAGRDRGAPESGPGRAEAPAAGRCLPARAGPAPLWEPGGRAGRAAQRAREEARRDPVPSRRGRRGQHLAGRPVPGGLRAPRASAFPALSAACRDSRPSPQAGRAPSRRPRCIWASSSQRMWGSERPYSGKARKPQSAGREEGQGRRGRGPRERGLPGGLVRAQLRPEPGLCQCWAPRGSATHLPGSHPPESEGSLAAGPRLPAPHRRPSWDSAGRVRKCTPAGRAPLPHFGPAWPGACFLISELQSCVPSWL
ncbi:PREDICTED: translation initiation factor IF-2-like, partial [Chinchilla lanigera]|uniref:translation initiation factor IF-2-like n=1 Tax=Chinchilla lanigera TaxID=34839 RepID=UPI000698BE70